MYIWVQGEWDHVNGMLLETEQKIGTVKIFDDYIGDVTYIPNFAVIKEPKMWTFNTDPTGRKEKGAGKEKNCMITGDKIVHEKKCMNTVQEAK